MSTSTALDEGSEPYEIAQEAKQSADKTQALTRQLMTFAEGGEPIKETASMEALLAETTTQLLRGSNVHPEYHFSHPLFPVEIDPGQISQVIQNLVLNADQAMPPVPCNRIYILPR